MAEVNKISSFKSFSEIKAQENDMKLREENNLKKQETLSKIEEILDEMGLTNLSEIDEDSQKTFISKLLGREMNEGNAFVYAASKAKSEGKDEFEFNGKKYKVTIKDTGVKEGNAFGDAVRKAKEEGATEFEFDGKTYKVEESEVNEGAHGMATKILKSIVDGESSKAEGVKMSKESLGLFEATVEMDAMDPDDKDFLKFLKKHKVEIIDKRMDGPGRGTPIITMQGKRKDLEAVLADEEYGWDDADLAEYIEESVVNEAATDLIKYVETASEKTFKAGGNGQNLLDSALELASHIGNYQMGRVNRGPEEDGFYGPATVTLFKRLVDQMSADDIKNNQADKYESVVTESVVNEGKEMYKISIDTEGEDSKIGNKFYNVKKGEKVELVDDDGDIATVKLKSGEVVNIESKYVVESTVTEGKDDYMARFGSANINLKKGYKHHTEDELNDLYNKLGDLVKTLNVKDVTLVFESKVNEAEIKSDDEFKEYAFSVLKKAFGSDFDEAKAGDVVKGILGKADGDYGAAVGMLTGSLGESVTNEATNIVKILRKLGWAGETWTPQELASQIKNLDDSTLIAWSKDNKGIPNTPLAFQMKLVDAEMEKRGLSESFTNEDIDVMIAQES